MSTDLHGAEERRKYTVELQSVDVDQDGDEE
jgi:hypothetical protein